MKYGESAFDLIYLAFAIISGIYMICRAGNKTGKLMGTAAIVLGFGDAFHLIPRVLNYFTEGDLSAALGTGKLITSITMTVFYVILFHIWLLNYKEKHNTALSAAIYVSALVRIIICAFPQNGWFDNTSNIYWSIARNIPFVLLGTIICILYYKKRNEDRCLKHIWLYVLLSFAFYIPVAVGAAYVPILGMLMLPKTVCYVLMLVSFLDSVNREDRV